MVVARFYDQDTMDYEVKLLNFKKLYDNINEVNFDVQSIVEDDYYNLKPSVECHANMIFI